MYERHQGFHTSLLQSYCEYTHSLCQKLSLLGVTHFLEQLKQLWVVVILAAGLLWQEAQRDIDHPAAS